MAHEVDFTVPKRDLGRADIEFDVKVDGTTLGALHVSRGSVVWYPAGFNYGHKCNWTEFAKLMVDHAHKQEKR
jgi:hypothetical protein